jgi:hypothetical protein
MVFLFLDKAVEKFTVKVTKVIADENLTQEQVYSAEETLPFWCYCPERPCLPSARQSCREEGREAQNNCVPGTNGAGAHEGKLAVVGQRCTSRFKPHVLKE